MYGPVAAIFKKVAPGGVTLSGHHIPDGSYLMVYNKDYAASTNKRSWSAGCEVGKIALKHMFPRQ